VSADVILGRLKQGYGGQTTPPPVVPATPTQSFDPVGGISSLVSDLFKTAEKAGGSGLNQLANFAEQDLIKPLETLGSDTYNTIDDLIKSVGDIARIPRTLTDTVKSANDLIKSLKDLTNSGTQWIQTGGPSVFPTLPGGITSLLPSVPGLPYSQGGGGNDSSSLTLFILVGGVVAAGIVIYAATRKRK
jgi:hypothetical protein